MHTAFGHAKVTAKPRPQACATAWVRRLLRWFARARRPMPWRDRPDPYAVWISEIMLQQTQVATVRPFFDRFMARFPTIASLAAAPVADVLHAWQGLGYYARARHLHRAAAEITTRLGGRWPATAAEWRALPGVGDYTAAAIASIAFGERIPSVDGNVVRVFSRFWMLPGARTDLALRREIAARLAGHIPRRAPGDFNQAMMELGALVCAPRHPDCGACPLARDCAAHRAGRTTDFPARTPARCLPLRRRVAVAVRRADGALLLQQRPERGLLGGLWDLPALASRAGETERQALGRLVRPWQLVSCPAKSRPTTVVAVYSHFRERTRVFDGVASTGAPAPSGASWCDNAACARLPLTALARRYTATVGP